jgi:flagellar motor switch protein FliM
LADILSQSEIDALLAAISTGEVKADDIKNEAASKKVRVYDFKRPNKFSKEQLHTLSIIHENFARLLTTYLSAQLRTLVQINVFYVEQMTYNEFVSSVPNPSLISVVDLSPLKGAGILEINPSIGFAIIDLLLGGTGEFNGKLREPTEIENSIIEKVFQKTVRILQDAWNDIAEINPSIEKLETNSQFVQLVSSNEAVALITLNATIGNTDGMINICLPHIVIEPIMSKLSARIWLSATKEEVQEGTINYLKGNIYKMDTQIRAELGKATITVGDFLHLAEGDVIPLNKSIEDGIDIYIKNRLKFRGAVGIQRNKLAVKITKLVAEEDTAHG